MPTPPATSIVTMPIGRYVVIASVTRLMTGHQPALLT